MAKIGCFAVLIKRGKKKSKGVDGFSEMSKSNNGKGTLHVKLGPPINAYVTVVQEDSTCNIEKVGRDENSIVVTAVEEAYEGSDEHDENASTMKRDLSDFDLQAQADGIGTRRKIGMSTDDTVDIETNDQSESRSERETEVSVELTPSGHVSDPGTGKAKFWATPVLKRSCSNLETRGMLREMLIPKSSRSFEDLKKLRDKVTDVRFLGSPASVMTHRSADRVMLKKHSSSQILPSRSKRLWWKLFLWSHRNQHKAKMEKQTSSPVNQILDREGGYCSDSPELSRVKESSKMESSGTFKGELRMKDKQKWDTFQGGSTGLWPQNQWVAFPGSSSLTRVDEWVNNLDYEIHPLPEDEEDTGDEDIVFPPSPETKESKSTSHATRRHNLDISEELLHANTVIQSLNSSSNVAHISGMSLKVIPSLSRFSSLRSVNLSGNFIVRITPGSLPKGLHTLNLSRNKIACIEGLRELTRLRVLDLSYNRISRIGHGVSSCTLIKELYLAGNKISDVEGLHRLLKLTVVDLSFNKITTAKALGQLVANYHSMQALNLLGNPIQNNIGDDHLRKVVSGLLPQLVYLNKQPMKPQRSREVATNSVAKAALGNNGWTSRRKTQKRVGARGSSTASSGYSKSYHLGAVGRKDKLRSNNDEKRRYPIASTSH